MTVHRLVDLSVLDDAGRSRVREIYEDAFPVDLRADFDTLLSDRVLVRVDGKDGVDGSAAPEGLAVLRPLAGTPWTFLRYYAVGARGGGIGTAMLHDLVDLLASEGCSLLVWDVEDPDEPGLTGKEVVEHRRRIAFYERAGGLLLPVRGYAPPHGDDLDGHAPALRLMCRPCSGAVPSTRDVLVATLTGRYGLAPDHPALLRALDASGLA